MLAGVWLFAAPAGAVTALSSLSASSDVSIDLDGAIAGPQRIVVDDLRGGVTPLDVGSLPAGAQITAFALLPGGDQLLAFDVPVAFGTLTTRPGDVVRRSGDIVTLAFDSAANGVPSGAGVDAVSEVGGDLLLSFDTAVALPGASGPIAVNEADLVRRRPTSFTLFFDGAAAGVPAGLNLDGAQHLDNGHLLLSFDGSGRIGDVAFDDEDVLELDPATMSWQLAYDGSAAHAQWRGADLTALFARVVADTPTATPSLPPTATRTVAASPTAATATASPMPSPSMPPTATGLPTGIGATATPPPPATPTATPSPRLSTCGGDCDGDGQVAINELILIVDIALGANGVDACAVADRDANGSVAINEIIAAVNEALSGCPS